MPKILVRTHYKDSELLFLLRERLNMSNLSAVVLMESERKSRAYCINAGGDCLYPIAQIDRIEAYIKSRTLVERNGFMIFKEGVDIA